MVVAVLLREQAKGMFFDRDGVTAVGAGPSSLAVDDSAVALLSVAAVNPVQLAFAHTERFGCHAPCQFTFFDTIEDLEPITFLLTHNQGLASFWHHVGGVLSA